MKKFTADFETATWKDDETWVWAWAVCDIETQKIQIGNSIESFFEFCEKENNGTFYFHNLKFDGSFIIYYLLENGYKHIKSKKEAETHSFTTLISDLGQFYSITVYFKVGNKKTKKATFIDSLKIINMPVREIARTFGLSISKLELDYKEKREKGHILTKHEEEYIKNDVKIVAEALKILFSENLTKMTSAGNAIYDYKEIISQSKFSHYFPNLSKEVDEQIRESYKRWIYLFKPNIQRKRSKQRGGIGREQLVSVRPVMYEKLLPFGNPQYFKGKYKEDKIYPLYIQTITCSFNLKKDKIPTIQIKNNRFLFKGNEYLENSNNEIICLTLTNIDLKLFFEQYEVHDLEFVDGFKFKGINGLFTKYIDKWIEVKNKATIEGNKGRRAMAKLQLNSLYGKFATSLEAQSKIPFLGEDKILHFRITEKEDKNGIYIPVRNIYNSLCKRKNDKNITKYKDIFT